MNELVFKSNEGNLVTTSKLVAEKFGKEHKHVLDAVRNICSSAENSAQFYESTTYKDSTGRSNEMFIMNRDGFSLLVMGFTGEKALQFKLDFIAAFNKMEQSLKQKLPATYLDALKALVTSEEAKQLAEKQVIELQPKAEVFDQIANSESLLTLNEAAKAIGIGRNNMMKHLRLQKILNANNNAAQRYIEQGYFEVKVKPIIKGGIAYNYSQTFVTGKGVTWLANKFENETTC